MRREFFTVSLFLRRLVAQTHKQHIINLHRNSFAKFVEYTLKFSIIFYFWTAQDDNDSFHGI